MSAVEITVSHSRPANRLVMPLIAADSVSLTVEIAPLEKLKFKL